MTGRPRLGFLGVGSIGRHRLRAAIEHGQTEIVAIADLSSERRAAALELAPDAIAYDSIARLLEMKLDGLVIATPSSLHAEQAVAALSRGLSVFCQKPLGRSAVEAALVVDTARATDRLLGVDLPYRHTQAAQAVRRIVEGGDLGRVYAIDLALHGHVPASEWSLDRARSGGGCVIDQGTHLVDLALWLLGFPAVRAVDALLFAGGTRLAPHTVEVEDFAHVQVQLEGGPSVRLACSWRRAVGNKAVLEASIHGTGGSRSLDLADPGSHALASWIETLRATPRFDRAADQFVAVARVIDAVYGGTDEA